MYYISVRAINGAELYSNANSSNGVFTNNITDNLIGKGLHSIKWFFHFNSDILVEKHGVNSVIATDSHNDKCIEIIFNGSLELNFIVKNDYVSPSYGIKKNAKTLVVSTKAYCPCSLSFQILLK